MGERIAKKTDDRRKIRQEEGGAKHIHYARKLENLSEFPSTVILTHRPAMEFSRGDPSVLDTIIFNAISHWNTIHFFFQHNFHSDIRMQSEGNTESSTIDVETEIVDVADTGTTRSRYVRGEQPYTKRPIQTTSTSPFLGIN